MATTVAMTSGGRALHIPSPGPDCCCWERWNGANVGAGRRVLFRGVARSLTR